MGRRVLPLVERMILNVNVLFIEYVGPFGEMLADECYMMWLENDEIGMGPRGVIYYVGLLSDEIENPTERQKFKEAAIARVRA